MSGISDHDMIVTDSDIKPAITGKPARKRYRLNKADWTLMDKAFCDLSSSSKIIRMNNQDVDQLSLTFRNNVMKIIKSHVPS